METSVFLKRDRELIRERKQKERFPYAGRAKREAEVIVTLFKTKVILLHWYYYGKGGKLGGMSHTQK